MMDADVENRKIEKRHRMKLLFPSIIKGQKVIKKVYRNIFHTMLDYVYYKQ